MPKKILIVDDDPVQRRLLDALITKFGYTTLLAEDGAKALSILSGNNATDIQLIVLDLIMPEPDGFGVLDKMREWKLTTPVIVQTATAGIETVVKAMRRGAYDFVVKPVSPERLKVSIENALSLGAMKDEISRIKKTASGKLTFNDIISASPPMQQVIAMGKKAASSNIPVLIEGESGVGKELIARAIQGSSKRAGKKFVTVNCGALPENLIESILFGHEKGSFTGATDRHIGKFVEADGGTLFLDEVGELPPAVQVKLLRVLQEGEVDPVGAKNPVKTDFRLISATNRTLQEETLSGNFREDLYYRLNVLPITIPPLRERKIDIAELAHVFLARFAMEEGRSHIKSIHPQALQLLSGFDWPGNIRQLENAIFRATVLCEGNALSIDDFPQIASTLSQPVAVHEAPVLYQPQDTLTPIADSEFSVSQENTQGEHHSTRMISDNGEIKELEDIEAEMIRFAVEFYNGKLSEVAKRLGIGRSTLYRRLKELGIETDSQSQNSAAS